MQLLIACATVILAFAIFLDRSRVEANGLLFVLKDYVRQIFRWVTLKRVIYAVGIFIFVYAAWRALGFDWAVIAVGGDTMLYLEIVSAVYLVMVRGYIQQVAMVAAKAITGKIQEGITSFRSRGRDRRSQRHSSLNSDGSEEDGEPAVLQAFAF